MDHVEVLRKMLSYVEDALSHERMNQAAFNMHQQEKQAIEAAITALSAEPEGGSGVSDKRGDHAEALAGLLAAGGADPLSQSERAALKAAIGILCADPPRSHGVVVDEAMIDAYLFAQAKAVQAVDDKWGGGGKAASYLHPVREACRAGLQAALVAALGEGE